MKAFLSRLASPLVGGDAENKSGMTPLTPAQEYADARPD
jgi:hypothetical protein